MTASDYLAEHEPRRLALILGNARYAHLAALPGVVLDIDQMQARLLALDFQVTRCLDIASVAQFENDVLPAFRRQIQAGDLVVFYFSGHGFSHGGEQYLALADSDLRIDARRLADVAIAVDSLQDYLSRPLPGLLLLVLDACRAIAGFAVLDHAGSPMTLKGEPPARRPGDARINLLSAYASRSGMPAIAGDDSGGEFQPSLFTAELLAQLGLDDREFGDLFNEVSARVRQASDERQQPGLLDWSDTDLYLRVPAPMREQHKEAWLVALASKSRALVQRFAYRYSISRHAAAARAWLAENATTRPPSVGLRNTLMASATVAATDGLLLELVVPPWPGGLPELLKRSVVEHALSDLRDNHRRISSVSVSSASSLDPDQSELREARVQHAIYLLGKAGINRREISTSHAPVGDDVRLRFFGHRQ